MQNIDDDLDGLVPGEDPPDPNADPNAVNSDDALSAKIEAILGNLLPSAMQSALAGMQQQSAPRENDDDEPVSYNPREIEERAGRQALSAQSLLQQAREELMTHPKLQQLGAAEINSIIDSIAGQGPKHVQQVIGSRQHIELAAYRFGKLALEDKVQAGKQRSEAPLQGAPHGPGNGGRATSDEQRAIKDYIAEFGRKPSAEALAILVGRK